MSTNFPKRLVEGDGNFPPANRKKTQLRKPCGSDPVDFLRHALLKRDVVLAALRAEKVQEDSERLHISLPSGLSEQNPANLVQSQGPSPRGEQAGAATRCHSLKA